MQIENRFGMNTVGQPHVLRVPAPSAPQDPAQGAGPVGTYCDGLAMSNLGRAMASASRGLEDATAVRPDQIAAFRHIAEGKLSLTGSEIDKVLQRLADA